VEVMSLPLSVALFVCEKDYVKTFYSIFRKPFGILASVMEGMC